MQINFGILKNKNSQFLFWGQLLSQMGDKSMSIGLVWMLAQNFSEKTIPWFLAMSALPHLLLYKKTAKWINHLGLTQSLVVTDLIRGFLFLLLGILWGLNSQASSENINPLLSSPESNLILLFCFSFLANCASALFNPAIMALPPYLAKDSELQSLNALIDSSFSISLIVGPIISLFWYPLIGLKGLFFFNAVTFFIAAICNLQIPYYKVLENKENSADVPTTQNSITSLLKKDKIVKHLFYSFLFLNIFISPLVVFLPLFVKDRFFDNITYLSKFELSIGVGTLLGSLLLTIVNIKIKTGYKIIISMLTLSLMYLTFTVSTNFQISIFALFIMGLTISIVNILAMTLFQERLDLTLQPQFMSYLNLISIAITPMSLVFVGLLLNWFSLQMISIISASFLCLITLFVISSKLLRELI